MNCRVDLVMRVHFLLQLRYFRKLIIMAEFRRSGNPSGTVKDGFKLIGYCWHGLHLFKYFTKAYHGTPSLPNALSKRGRQIIFLRAVLVKFFSSTPKKNHALKGSEMATVKQEISDVVIKTEPKEENIKLDSQGISIKAEPNEEKTEDISDKPTNVKTEGDATNGDVITSTDETNELDKKIIRQIEYYFGDFNLPKDKFLKEQMGVDDGWIPIATMLKFARLSQLTKSPKVIFNAMKKSTSGLMEVDESASKIRRSKNQPIPEETAEYLAEIKARTIYCKGFPKEGMSIDKLLDFFKSFPTALSIKMRYFKTKEDCSKFKGSITATFSTKEEASKFMALESVKYNDYTLQRQWSAEWEKEKEQEFEERQKRKAKKITQENGNVTKPDDNVKEEKEKIVLSRGAVLKLVNLPSGIDRDAIKQAFATYPADIAHVEITPDSTAFVRLRGENDGKLVLDKLENKKICVNDASVEVSLLEGEEEETYLKKAEDNVNNRVMNMGRGGFRGRGGRGRGRGRGGRGGRGGGYKGKDRKREGSVSGGHGEGSSKRSRDD
uniref:EOG090X0CQA n=1 Tax=Daphnia magna TaxID=35525 RepID=A0A4Y7MK00_9CRUS|nr:EOG090X0CQA [Daphnia magna]